MLVFGKLERYNNLVKEKSKSSYQLAYRNGETVIFLHTVLYDSQKVYQKGLLHFTMVQLFLIKGRGTYVSWSWT